MTTSPLRSSDLAEETFVGTVRRLAGAQKPAAKGSPAYSRFVNRRIGRVLAAAAFHTGLTPNQVTAISAAFSFAAIAAIGLVAPTPLTSLLISLGLLAGYAFDSADGQLARLRGGGSPAGEWLDHVVDSVKVVVLHLAVLIGWFRFGEVESWVLLLPLAFALVSSVFFFVQILTDQLRRAHRDQTTSRAAPGAPGVIRSLIVLPTDYGVLCILFALMGWPIVFQAAYVVMLIGTALFLLAALPKWYRDMAAFGRP